LRSAGRPARCAPGLVLRYAGRPARTRPTRLPRFTRIGLRQRAGRLSPLRTSPSAIWGEWLTRSRERRAWALPQVGGGTDRSAWALPQVGRGTDRSAWAPLTARPAPERQGVRNWSRSSCAADSVTVLAIDSGVGRVAGLVAGIFGELGAVAA